MKNKFFKCIIIGLIMIASLMACQSVRPPVQTGALYTLMTQQDNIEFNEFPVALESMRGHQNCTIYANEKDTLQLVCSYPNMADKKNRYPLYYMADNHGNSWTLVQEGKEGNGKYKIHRLDQRDEKEIITEWVQAFCGGGVALAWIIAFILLMVNLTADNEKEQVSLNNVIKLILLAFFIGGCGGLCLM